jgi:H/ACA ribonucleoprotein complex subunit 3
MRTQMRKCEKCGSYTMKDTCQCGGVTVIPQPPRYSPQDRYGKYRRQLKKMDQEK